MKKVFAATLLLAFASSSAHAFDFQQSKLSVGGGYGLGNGGVLSLHADYDISDMAEAPVKARGGWDHYSIDTGGFGGGYTWSYNVFYGGAYYDFNKMLKIDHKIHPFAGLGFGFGSASCSGTLCNGVSTPTAGGFYYIGGVQYNYSKKIDAEVNFSGWGGIGLGANFKF